MKQPYYNYKSSLSENDNLNVYRWMIAMILIGCLHTTYAQSSHKPVLAFKSQTCSAETLDDFFDCYGGRGEFSPQYQDAVTTFINAEDALKAGEYAQMKTLLDDIWSKYPVADAIWYNATQEIKGTNVGNPYAYYGLRMMDDIVDYHLNHQDPGVKTNTIVIHVVLPGCTQGVMPSTIEELNSGTGTMVTRSLDPLIADTDYRIVKQSLDLFLRYVTAITRGALEFNLNFVELPDLCLEGNVSTTKPYIAGGDVNAIWDELSSELQDSTDWWWLLYPSFLPEGPAFDTLSFITGGAGADAKGGPFIIANDTWIVDKPPHLGTGNYTDIERRIYLPQWFMHEFYHHFYRIYPEFNLEDTSHKWFDRSKWPSDFEGIFEPDYYTESLHKRLLSACTPLARRLKTTIDPKTRELYADISQDEIIGTYSLDKIENDFHEADIIKIGQSYYWKNKAGVQWSTMPDIEAGVLRTGSDTPYPGEDFFIDLVENTEGGRVAGIQSLIFQGEKYYKRSDLFRDSIHVEMALGTYQRSLAVLLEHTGQIIKRDGKYYWENDNHDLLSLFPDVDGEFFESDLDNPSDASQFKLSFSNDGCGMSISGFTLNGKVFQKLEEANAYSFSPCLDGYADEYTLSGGQVDGRVYITNQSIESSQCIGSTTFPISVRYTAGPMGNQSINLLKGFEVKANTFFQADHEGCKSH